MRDIREINKTKLMQVYRRKRALGCRYPFSELAREFDGDRRQICDYLRSRYGTNDQISGGVAQEDKPVRLEFVNRWGGKTTMYGDDRAAMERFAAGLCG